MKIKSKILILVISILTSLSFAGTEIQNGGVGLKIDGKVATFYSAKLDVIPAPLTQIGGLDRLLNEIGALRIGSRSKFKLISAIIPGPERKYFQVNNERSNDANIRQIIEEYQRSIGATAELTILGITNPVSKNTLLFSDFFNLSPIEKSVILFHESMWITGHIGSISQMIEIEYLFQQYLENKNKQSTFMFYGLLGEILEDDYSWQLYAALESDMAFRSEINIQDILSENALAYFVAYQISKIGDEKKLFALMLLQEMQKIVSDTTNEFFYSRTAFKNFLLKRMHAQSEIFKIQDKEILDKYYPAEVYTSVFEDPQYKLTLQKIQKAKIKLEKFFGQKILVLNADNKTLLELGLTP